MNRTLVGLGAALLLLAIVVLLVGFGQSLAAVKLQHITLPGAGTFRVDAPGSWLVWHTQPVAMEHVNAERPSVVPAAHGPAGEVVESSPTVRTIRFTNAESVHTVVGRYEISTLGPWRIDGPAGTWAVGPDPMGDVMLWSIGTTALAILLLGAALCTGWIGLRRPHRHGSTISGVSEASAG